MSEKDARRPQKHKTQVLAFITVHQQYRFQRQKRVEKTIHSCTSCNCCDWLNDFIPLLKLIQHCS